MTTEFKDIQDEFTRRIGRTVWCTVATVDTRGRPRTRILHPVWDNLTGYIATNRHSLKERHLANNPYVSITYWDPAHEQVYIEATAEWEDDQREKARVWDLFKATPPPLGYDPAMIWKDGPEGPDFGVLRLKPWRIELFSLGDMSQGKQSLVWRAG